MSLYYSPNFEHCSETDSIYNKDVYAQLHHLKSKLNNGAGNKMQSIYPEGFLFINVLYGLTWTELISSVSMNSPIYKEGIKEVLWVQEELSSPEAKIVFDKNLPLKYGAFYRGWTNYLLGKKLLIQPDDQKDSLEILAFKSNCYDISFALSRNEGPFLETYENQKWPADGIIAMASLNMYEALFGDDLYRSQIRDWLEDIKEHLDPETGLIPHYVYGKNDDSVEGARGSSQSLLLIFLNEIDTSFSQQQFINYKRLFFEKKLGLNGIREYAKGEDGESDIDSGPVIWDIGAVSSIVGQKTFGCYKDWNGYIKLRNNIETFGLAYSCARGKKYLLGMLPMADAFIAWSNVTEKRELPSLENQSWRIEFQILSLLILGITGLAGIKLNNISFRK